MKPNTTPASPDRPAAVSRRTFLGASAAGGAAVLTGGWASLAGAAPRVPRGDEDAPWFEASIPQLQKLMRTHRAHEPRADPRVPESDRAA